MGLVKVMMCVCVWESLFIFQVMLQYNVPDFKNHQEFLTLFAKKRGFLQKGGIPNSDQAAEVFLCDWTGYEIFLCITVLIINLKK